MEEKQSLLIEPVTQQWRTPPDFVKAVTREFGHIYLDVCADAQNTLATYWIDRAKNSLITEWVAPVGSLVWMNPPYGKECSEDAEKGRPQFPGTRAFVMRAHSQSIVHRVRALVLVEARTDTEWWHTAASLASETRLLPGRLQFLRPDGEVGTQPKCGHSLFVFDGEASRKRPGIIWCWDWRAEVPNLFQP